MKNKIAIVIPYFKIDFFEETIQSIAQQTDNRFSLYIGNDASPNNPLPIINKYLKEDEYVYFEYKENVGGKNLALQWERILENVEEDWFQILGDDDVIATNFVESFYNNLDIIQNNVIRVDRKVVNGENKLIREDFIDGNSVNSISLFIDGYSGKTITSLSEFIFNKNQFNKYKFHKIPLAWGTDVLAFIQFSEGRDITLINDTHVSIKVTDKSITGNNSTLGKVKEDAFNIFRKKIIEEIGKYLPIEFKNQIIKDYYYYCWKTSTIPTLNIVKVYLLNGDVINFIKKLYLIYKFKIKLS